MFKKELLANRRDMLKATASLAGIAAVAVIAIGQKAHAEGSIPQASVQYQTTPKGSSKCSNCSLFVPGASATANGQCTAVAGVISPNGWCSIWSAKS
jgi:hypothetical protein